MLKFHTNVALSDNQDVHSLIRLFQMHQVSLEPQQSGSRLFHNEKPASADPYLELFESLPVACVALDEQGFILEANAATAALLQLPLRDITGKSLAAFILPSYQDIYDRHCDALFAGRSRKVAEVGLVSPAANHLFVKLSSVSLYSPARRQTIGLVTMTDLTCERLADKVMKRMNEELGKHINQQARKIRAGNARFEAILDAAADAIVIISEQGQIESVNRAALKMFDYQRRHLLGRPIGMLIQEPFANEHTQYLMTYLNNPRTCLFDESRELMARRSNASHFPVNLSLAQVKEAQVFIVIIRDISFRKQMELEVLRASEQERMRISRDLHDGVGQNMAGLAMLASSLSRTLKNEGFRDAQAVEALSKEMEQVAQDIRRVINDLGPAELSEPNLASALQKLVKKMSHRTATRIDFQVDELVRLNNHTVEVQLLRICQEALSNALQHAGASRITIKLEVSEAITQMSITDNGCGFPMEPAPPLEDPDETRGHGLNNMKYRAQLIGASLNIYSSAETGTRITCTLFKPGK
jgi:PAS domain S-box-containing protein